jgi:hypothetical protein
VQIGCNRERFIEEVMPHAYTKDQLVEQPAIDRTVLETRGWASFTMPSADESDLRDQLIAMAAGLGTQAAMRSGGSLCDALKPMKAEAAKRRSLSKIYSAGEFPLHNDTAHWLVPCRYVSLACVSPGSGNRPTLLLDTRRLPLTNHQASLLHSTPLRITNGRNSFFSTIFSKGRPFVRFDPGCMSPTTPDGAEALDVLSRHNWPDYIETVHWEAGKVLVMDNRPLLHGRGLAGSSDSDRKLLRISIR